MKRNTTRGFTVVELLVVVAIIALLVGILLPAIGKARDGALTSQSQSNLRQIGTAWQTYAGEFADRQMTFINDYISKYGNYAATPGTAQVCQGYATANGMPHPPIVIGYVNWPTGSNTMAPYVISWNTPAYGGSNGTMNAAWVYSQPMVLTSPGNPLWVKLGSYRMFNSRPLSTYLNGRWYDPVFYAPKDRGVLNVVEPYFDSPYEAIFESIGGATVLYWPSYVLSPAAMWSPDATSEQHGASNFNTAPLFNRPWTLPSGLKSPSLSQARYANLKTLAIEHQWLQNNKRGVCNPAFGGNGFYQGCEPWYYNASILSNPMCVFYDGHVAGVGVRDAMDSNQRVLAQHGQNLTTGTKGLWTRNTSLGGTYEPPATGIPQGGYWHNAGAADGACTSFHILTSYGIKGRDIIPK